MVHRDPDIAFSITPADLERFHRQERVLRRLKHTDPEKYEKLMTPRAILRRLMSYAKKPNGKPNLRVVK
ncbi:MAG TPA: hypothetical protein VD928_00405 [Candidatus Paceibacterota bacterium]|nr:hypothetical protein [Candidatus Paceibacterota bacterium]